MDHSRCASSASRSRAILHPINTRPRSSRCGSRAPCLCAWRWTTGTSVVCGDQSGCVTMVSAWSRSSRVPCSCSSPRWSRRPMACRRSSTRALSTASSACGRAGCRTQRRSKRTLSSLERMGGMEGHRTTRMSPPWAQLVCELSEHRRGEPPQTPPTRLLGAAQRSHLCLVLGGMFLVF